MTARRSVPRRHIQIRSEMTTHEEVKKRAQQAIHALHNDRSVSSSQTCDDLEDLRDEIELLLCALPK